MNNAALTTTTGSSLYYLQDVKQELNISLFTRFIDYTDRKETTVKGYVTCIKHFIKWLQENGITQPQRDDLKAYRKYLESSGLATGTQQQYLGEVKRFFKWTENELREGRPGYINIAENLHSPKVRQDIHKKDALSRDDVPIIAESIERDDEQGKRLYAMYLLCITCGLRTIEIHRANVEDIKTVGGITYLYIQGKGKDDKDAPVELIPEVKEALNDYLKHREAKPTAKSPLFTSTSNRSKGGRIATTTISTMLKEMLKNAGYDSDRLTAHSLRHTSGTGAYMATGNLFLAQKHQRHADPSTTEIYIHAHERQERHTEQQVFNYYFKGDRKQDKEAQAIELIKGLDPAKLEQVIIFINAIK